MKSSAADAPVQRTATIAGVTLGVTVILIGYLLGVLLKVSGMALAGFALAVGLVVGILVRWMSLRLTEATGRSFGAFLQPSGRSTPYQPEFSQLQAMAAKGDVAGALAGYDAELARDQANVTLRLQAAELHARAGNPRRAAELFAAARRLTTARSHELYATQRLIDLALAPGGDNGRALSEMRRLVDRFPGTPEADGARKAMAEIRRNRNEERGTQNRNEERGTRHEG